MDFAFNEDQEELRRYVRQWLEERSPSDTVRTLMSTSAGSSAQLWAETAEMGLVDGSNDQLTPEQAYERQWALTVLDRSLERLRRTADE